VNTPELLGTTLMLGYFLRTFWNPTSRSESAGWPAKPRVYQTVPVPPIWSKSHLAPSSAYLTWLLYRFQVFGSVTYASTEIVLIPAAAASLSAGLSASGSFG